MTGVQGGPPAPVSDVPRFGWRDLFPILTVDSEKRVAVTLRTKYGLDIEDAGARNQSYDLRIKLIDGPFARVAGLETGNYEIKSLWRRNGNCVFDRRFKAGQRGERIYGLRDSRIKAFAMGLDAEIDSVIANSVRHPTAGRSPSEMRSFFEETVDFIQQATERRHSKDFEARLMRLARICQVIPTMTALSRGVLNSPVGTPDIVNGYRDLEGIFVVAGPIYTLVTVKEIARFLAFDSASSEGPKLRYTQNIPLEKKRAGEKNGI